MEKWKDFGLARLEKKKTQLPTHNTAWRIQRANTPSTQHSLFAKFLVRIQYTRIGTIMNIQKPQTRNFHKQTKFNIMYNNTTRLNETTNQQINLLLDLGIEQQIRSIGAVLSPFQHVGELAVRQQLDFFVVELEPVVEAARRAQV